MGQWRESIIAPFKNWRIRNWKFDLELKKLWNIRATKRHLRIDKRHSIAIWLEGIRV